MSQDPTVSFSSLPHLVEHQAKRSPDAPAILAPGRAPLSFGRLFQHIDQMGRTLRAMGIGRRHRMAVVLPNGPEMAVAVLTVAASAMCAPMNPAYGAEEFDRYFGDLRPHALLTVAGLDSPARRVALLTVSPCRRAIDRICRRGRSLHAHGRSRGCVASRAGTVPATWRCCCSRQAQLQGKKLSRSRTPTSVRRLTGWCGHWHSKKPIGA